MSNKIKLKPTKRYSKTRVYFIKAESTLGKSMAEYEAKYLEVNKAASDFVNSVCETPNFNVPKCNIAYEPDLYEAGGCMGIITPKDIDKSLINPLVWTCEKIVCETDPGDYDLIWYPRVLGDTVVHPNELLPVIIPEHFEETEEYRLSQQIEQQMSHLPKIGTGTLAALLKVKSQYEHPTKEQIKAETSLSWLPAIFGYYKVTTGGLIIDSPDAEEVYPLTEENLAAAINRHLEEEEQSNNH